MTYRILTLATVLAAIALIGACSSALGASLRSPVPASEAYPCGQEDAPTWAWSRCGNHRRGIVTRHGVVRVVGPCTFARFSREHVLDTTSTPRLKGDRYAELHGCDRAHGFSGYAQGN